MKCTPAARRKAPLGGVESDRGSRHGWRTGVGIALAFFIAEPTGNARAAAAFESADAALRATAHVDFRITILPTLALWVTSEQIHIEGNSGSVLLQRDRRSQWPTEGGRPPIHSLRLMPHRGLLVHELPAVATQGDRVTVASP